MTARRKLLVSSLPFALNVLLTEERLDVRISRNWTTLIDQKKYWLTLSLLLRNITDKYLAKCKRYFSSHWSRCYEDMSHAILEE